MIFQCAKSVRPVWIGLGLWIIGIGAFVSIAGAGAESPADQKTNVNPPSRISDQDAQTLGVGQDIGFVEQLIHHSVAAKQIIDSDNTRAKALRNQAANFLKQAKTAQSAGDDTSAVDTLNKAKQAIFQAMRLSGEKVVKEKDEADYKRRRKSVIVLLDAQKRVRKEKGGVTGEEEVEKHVEKLLRQADGEFKNGHHEKALALAKAAYLTVKLSVTRMRDGDTLVRTLHFETKKDEYTYELERNRTHKILVNVVLKDKLSVSMSRLMKIPMDRAEQLRHHAEKQAAGGHFEKAIEKLEESTQQIIRAIRMAGVFIPG